MKPSTARRIAQIICPPAPRASDALASAWFDGANIDGACLVDGAPYCYQTNYGAIYSDVPPDAQDFDARLEAQVRARFRDHL